MGPCLKFSYPIQELMKNPKSPKFLDLDINIVSWISDF